MTAEDLDALAADVGREQVSHADCSPEFCEGRVTLELARGYLSLRLVQADHERQIAALQAAYDDIQAALMKSITNVERGLAHIRRLQGERSAEREAALKLINS